MRRRNSISLVSRLSLKIGEMHARINRISLLVNSPRPSATRGRFSPERFYRLLARWIPVPRVLHPYPMERLTPLIQGGSRMREIRSYGFVRGVLGNHTKEL